MGKFTYLCPHCKTEQSIVVQYQSSTLKYEYDFEGDSWEERDVIGGDHDYFACYNCDEELPLTLEQEIFKQI